MAMHALSVVAGGLYHCDPAWSRPVPYARDYHRIYVPVSGAARYALGERWTELAPGHLYFVPAHRENRQACDRSMRVHWLHLAPASPALARGLAGLDAVLAWPEERWRWWRPTWTRIAEHVAGGGGAALGAAVHAFALAVVAAALERAGRGSSGAGDGDGRFQPAVALIERRFPAATPVAALARAMGMSEPHFRRAFRAAFGVPPRTFVERRRIEAAAALLASGDRPVAEIAAACGYDDPFHFSRVFRRVHRASPAAWRRARRAAP